ncbi:MAG: putative hydrolase of the superfamily [Actinomycetota bacterium]|nr:putative hydrolase of the superfamily [Actinomycetota bacterium]
MTIEAVLFDLHGVMTSSPWAALASVGEGTGASQDEVLAVMLGDYSLDGDHPWHRLERGEIGMGEYGVAVTALASAAGLSLDFGRLRGFNDQVVVNAEMVERARSLRASGVLTALVTNNIREMAAGWRSLLAADGLFDVVVDSSSVGVRKPNPAIFSLTLSRLGGVAPSSAVFLDDAPGNVAGAQVAGLHTILVTDPVAALASLDALLAGGG